MMADYPPLSDSQPIHPEVGKPPDAIWACSAPERPRSEDTYYDWRCRKCLTHAQASLANDGDWEMAWSRDADMKTVEIVSFSWLIERSLFWMDDQPQISW